MLETLDLSEKSKSVTNNAPQPQGQEDLVVVKLGGAEHMDYSACCADVAALQKQGLSQVLVHGGSAETNALGEALQSPARFITSPSGYTSRHTDRRTLEIFAMAVNGKLNTMLVEQLQGLGVNALGLSGLDGRLIVAERKTAVQSIENGKRKVIRDDYTGKIVSINTSLIHTLLKAGYTPVIAPLAVSLSGEALNVDADRAAAMVAGALNASSLVLLTAAPGLMRTYPDESTVIGRLPRARLDEALGYAEGRMKKKILGAREALEAGAGRVIIADGRGGQPITAALAEKGTVIQ
jgi:acetylglutamate/LysW-gamma-L-alpha-aminoadipate kinase